MSMILAGNKRINQAQVRKKRKTCRFFSKERLWNLHVLSFSNRIQMAGALSEWSRYVECSEDVTH